MMIQYQGHEAGGKADGNGGSLLEASRPSSDNLETHRRYLMRDAHARRRPRGIQLPWCARSAAWTASGASGVGRLTVDGPTGIAYDVQQNAQRERRRVQMYPTASETLLPGENPMQWQPEECNHLRTDGGLRTDAVVQRERGYGT